jgi:hypothetical protein
MTPMSIPLGRFSRPRLKIQCEPCRRRGDYSVARLVARFGSEIRLPDLLSALSAECPERQKFQGRCFAVYAEESRVGQRPQG